MFYISLKEKTSIILYQRCCNNRSVYYIPLVISEFETEKKYILKNVHNQTLANDLKSMATFNFLVKNRVFLSSTEGGNS